MSSVQKILPFYFRLPDKPIFGCYHEPSTSRQRSCGILICQPVGHEYVNSHRALRHLAVRLAEAGFPVLRFDYYGCGDSSGDSEDASVAQWLKDISAAVVELRRRSGLFPICMVGLRLGATLATLAAAQRGDVESAVLWDPVVEGEKYFDELLLLEKEMLRFRPKQRRNQKADVQVEVLGFPWSDGFIAEVKDINLGTIAQCFTKNLLVLRSNSEGSTDDWQGRVVRLATRVERRRLEAPEIWLPSADGSLLVPAQVLQAVVSWNSEIHS
jgi:pimeloyl-ACP methyl ester carboxylesterase